MWTLFSRMNHTDLLHRKRIDEAFWEKNSQKSQHANVHKVITLTYVLDQSSSVWVAFNQETFKTPVGALEFSLEAFKFFIIFELSTLKTWWISHSLKVIWSIGESPTESLKFKNISLWIVCLSQLELLVAFFWPMPLGFVENLYKKKIWRTKLPKISTL